MLRRLSLPFHVLLLFSTSCPNIAEFSDCAKRQSFASLLISTTPGNSLCSARMTTSKNHRHQKSGREVIQAPLRRADTDRLCGRHRMTRERKDCQHTNCPETMLTTANTLLPAKPSPHSLHFHFITE